MIKVLIFLFLSLVCTNGETFFSPSYKITETKEFYVVWCRKDARAKHDLFVSIGKIGEDKFYLKSEISDSFEKIFLPLFALPKSRFAKGDSIRLQASSSPRVNTGSNSKTTRVLGD